MPVPHPVPVLNETVNLVNYVNTVTDGVMIPLLLFGGVIIMYAMLITRFYKTSESFTVAFFVNTILGALFYWMGALAFNWVLILLILFIVTFLWSFFDD